MFFSQTLGPLEFDFHHSSGRVSTISYQIFRISSFMKLEKTLTDDCNCKNNAVRLYKFN